MKMAVEANLMYTDTDGIKVGVAVKHDCAKDILIPEFYMAMLKGMRDAHEHEFHMAMIDFLREELKQ